MYKHTSLQYFLINFQSKISSIFGVYPFTWDSKRKVYYLNAKSYNRFLSTSILCSVHYAYIILRIFFLSYEHNQANSYFLYLWLVILTILHTDFYIFFAHQKEFVVFLNAFESYTDYVAGTRTFNHLLKLYAEFIDS